MPIAIDLFCGLGGWTEGLLAEGYDVIGFDIERHQYESKCLDCDGTGNFYRNDEDGDWLNCDCYVDHWNHGKVIQKYPAQLVLQDVLTIHGSQFKDAALIVASPPCQEFSFMAMPFSRGKRIAAALRGKGEFPEPYTGSRTIAELRALFDACFRIQREAIEATGMPCPACDGLGPRHHGHVCPKCEGTCWLTRYIPMVVENVRGAQPWVGPAKAHYGSFYLWGDVDMVGDRIIAGGLRFGDSVKAAKRGQKKNPDGTEHGQGSWFKIADSKERGGRKGPGGDWFKDGQQGQDHCANGLKVPGMNFHDHAKTGLPGRSFQSAAVESSGVKCGGSAGDDWFAHHNRESFFERDGNKRDGHSHTRHLTNQRESDGVKQACLSGAGVLPKGTKVTNCPCGTPAKIGSLLGLCPACTVIHYHESALAGQRRRYARDRPAKDPSIVKLSLCGCGRTVRDGAQYRFGTASCKKRWYYAQEKGTRVTTGRDRVKPTEHQKSAKERYMPNMYTGPRSDQPTILAASSGVEITRIPSTMRFERGVNVDDIDPAKSRFIDGVVGRKA